MMRYVCPKHGLAVEVDPVQRKGRIEIVAQLGMPVGQCWLSTNFHRAFKPRNEDLEKASGASGCPVTRG